MTGNLKPTLVWLGILSCWLFFILEPMTDFWFGSKFPGYDWMKQSLSYLGQSGSPIEHLVLWWGIAFSLLLSLFGWSFYLAFEKKKWVSIATAFIIIYALGEGVGSGCFPINPPDTPVTLDGRLHNIFSGIGDTGIVLLPFVLMLMFPKKENRKFLFYLWIVVGLGLCMASFFLIAKFFHPDNFILHFKGVW